MARFAVCAFLALAALSAACVKAEDGGRDAAAKPADTGAADMRSNTPDTAAAPTTCREIRICVFNCRENATCAAACVSSAPMVARVAYNEAQMCSAQICPTQDIECRCDQECHGGGVCTQIVDECDEAISDPFCDGPCH